MSTTRLTIYLLKDVAKPVDALETEHSATLVPLTDAAGLRGAFYYSTRPPTTPHWVSFIEPLLSTRSISLRTSSASGLLILRASDRFFALTFGYGRALLDLSKIEHQFGLRVALNRIDPSQIRSIDTKTFEDMVVTRNTQTSKSSELPTFGIDVSRDILRAVTGEPRDRNFAKRLSGADALVVNLEIAALSLPKLCTELLKAFHEDSYKRDFAWIDHLSLVDDPPRIEQLNKELERQLTSRDTSATHMAMPESLDWADIDAFKITGTRAREYEDIDLDAYLDALGQDSKDLTISQLKSRRVSVRFSRTSEFDSRWTIYQCLVSEQRVDGTLHVLVEGRWFAVSESLVDEVDAYVSSLPATPTPPHRLSARGARSRLHRTAC